MLLYLPMYDPVIASTKVTVPKRREAIIICALFSAFACIPLSLILLGAGRDALFLAGILNALGWGSCVIVLVLRENTLSHLRKKLDLAPGRHLERRIVDQLDRVNRYERAAFSFQLEDNIASGDIHENLAKILLLAVVELDARSAELALSGDETQLCSQALLIGLPKTHRSQAMLIVEGEEDGGLLYEDPNGSKFLTTPVRFAGSTFGTLRVELRSERQVSETDLHVLKLIASQSAVILIDARFTDELLRMRELSEESVRAKTGFLANLSHEIRGPLGIILNGVELAQEGMCGEFSPEMRETLNMIKESGAHLLDLVNDVLDYAKAEAGKVQAKPVKLSAKDLLEDLTNVVRSQAVAKKHKLILENVDPQLGLVCDKRHARQMLINLLTNAIKYTPEGGTITVKGERYPGDRIKLSVQDTGIGIPESQHSKVFGAFERVDNSYAQNQTGTGLGMPLTLKLAQTNGGTVDFDSKEGAGSTFWLILPVTEIKDTIAESNEAGDGERLRYGRGEGILLVDPDADCRQMLERYLVEQGFVVHAASSGREVMKMLREKEIKVAVIDNDLPDLSGEEVVAGIRSSPKAASLPIVLVSSKAFVFDIERFLKLGVDRCLSKPVKLSELAFTARRLIDESKGSRVQSAPAPVLQ